MPEEEESNPNESDLDLDVLQNEDPGDAPQDQGLYDDPQDDAPQDDAPQDDAPQDMDMDPNRLFDVFRASDDNGLFSNNNVTLSRMLINQPQQERRTSNLT